MNSSKALAINTQLRWHETGAISAPFGYEGMDGVYAGFTPSDESAVGYGEYKVVIDPRNISFLIATGLKIERHVTDRGDWRTMTLAETTEWFNPGADVADVTGITYGESGMAILFLREFPDANSATVVGMPGYEVFGSSPLYRPTEVADGLFARAVGDIEEGFEMPGALPRLSCGGRAPRDV